MEEREDEAKREEKKKILLDKYGDTFMDFIVTVHKVKGDEMKCKAANTTYAAKKLKKYLEDKNYREIAETMGISEVNARVKMNRIKTKLTNIINP
jgi:hypothetical protein